MSHIAKTPYSKPCSQHDTGLLIFQSIFLCFLLCSGSCRDSKGAVALRKKLTTSRTHYLIQEILVCRKNFTAHIDILLLDGYIGRKKVK